MKEPKTRINLILNQDVKEAIDHIADGRGDTAQGVLREYVGQGLLSEAIVKEGGRIIAETGDGETRVLKDELGSVAPTNIRDIAQRLKD